MNDHQWPIIYSPEYNISLCGIERTQAYDTCKSGNIFALLKGGYFCSYNLIVNTVSCKVCIIGELFDLEDLRGFRRFQACFAALWQKGYSFS